MPKPQHLRQRRRRTPLVVCAVLGGTLAVAGSGVAALAQSTSTTKATTTTTKASTSSTTKKTTTTKKSTVTTKKTTTTAAPTTTSTVATTTTVPVTTPPTTAPVAPAADGLEHIAPAAVIDAGPKGLASGAKGEAVKLLEQRLTDLRFDPVNVDGTYDARTTLAVMAFQKQQGLPRTGKANPETLAKLAVADIPTPFSPTGEASRVEVDLPKQIAQFWKDGKLVRVLAISSGSGAHYCVSKEKGGGCDVAITPGGSYRADRKIKGDRESKLGHLYDPVYFNGGIALHGSPSIPAGPASHGCIRVAMWESKWVYDFVDIGMPVYVSGGKIAPVPFADTAPTETPDEVVAAPA